MAGPRKNSALFFILKGLIPYSRQNMMLSFSPNRFFDELERQSGYNHNTLREATRRAKKAGLINETSTGLRLTKLGERTVGPFMATKLPEGSKLMIIFDIPEDMSRQRQQLRSLLRKWQFEQTQKSVWITSFDHRQSVKDAVDELRLQGCVQLYECALLYPHR